MSEPTIWHDLECGTYTQDLRLWLGLAAEFGGPVLDVGAGTGRVALALARAGHRVVAVDVDAELLAVLSTRAAEAGLEIETVAADARELALRRRFPLCVVPMQTVQLLGDSTQRVRFLSAVREHLQAGGGVALAITTVVEEFEWHDGDPEPLPDIVELDGTVYSSQPTAVRGAADTFVLERRREAISAAGARTVHHDRIELHRLTVSQLQREGAAAGLTPGGVRRISPTPEHVGSEVVLLTAAAAGAR